VIFSATSLDFDIATYVKDAGGYLSTYREYLGTTEWTTGARAIERLAYENSVNPRLLLAILDYEAQWVRGKPDSDFRINYPLGYESYRYKGMFMQLFGDQSADKRILRLARRKTDGIDLPGWHQTPHRSNAECRHN